MIYFGTHARQLSHRVSIQLMLNLSGDPGGSLGTCPRNPLSARNVLFRQRVGRAGSIITALTINVRSPEGRVKHGHYLEQGIASARVCSIARRARPARESSRYRINGYESPSPNGVRRSATAQTEQPDPIAVHAATKAPESGALFPGAFLPNTKPAPTHRASVGAVFSGGAHAGSPGRVSSASGHPAIDQHGCRRAVFRGAFRQSTPFDQAPRSMGGRPVPQSACHGSADDRPGNVLVFTKLAVVVSHRCAPSKVAVHKVIHQ